MRETDDDVIWEYAKERGFIVVTKDSDFRDLSANLGHSPKVILITLGNGPTAEIESLLRERYGDLLSPPPGRGAGIPGIAVKHYRAASHSLLSGLGQFLYAPSTITTLVLADLCRSALGPSYSAE